MCGAELKVAVCGGGLGGLAFALAASKYPHLRIDIYESTSSFSSFGAGIGIWPRCTDVLSRLGITETLLLPTGGISSGPQPDHDMLSFRKSDQPVGYEFLKMRSQGRMHTIHRGDLQRALMDQVDKALSCTTHFSKRLRSYTRTSSGQLHLTFCDGSEIICDILIGADGLKSTVRKIFMQDEARVATNKGNVKAAEAILASVEPSWTGSIAYRELVPLARLEKGNDAHEVRRLECPTQYVGKNVNMIVYPVSQEAEGGLINMVLFHTQPELEATTYDGPWTVSDNGNRCLNFTSFEDWEPEANAWLKCFENPAKWAIHVVRPLHTFVNDRVALIGDAAHAMDPHQGAGAGQAIEDAFILAELLGGTKYLKGVSKALTLYDTLCRPFSQEVARSSRDNAHFLSLCWDRFDPNDTHTEMEDKLHELGDIMVDRWKWAWLTTIGETLEMAKRTLEVEDCKCRM